ncbi:MAG: hypothetical protein ABIJ61_07960 [bacterium]
MRWQGLARIAGCIAVLLLLTHPVYPAFEYSHCSGTSTALAGAVDLFAGAPLDLAYQPALTASPGFQFEASASRLFNLSDFTLSCAGARAGHGPFTLGLATTQLTGSDFYRERSYQLNAAVTLRGWLCAGMTVSYRELEYAGNYSELSATSLSAGLLARPVAEFRVAVSMLEINQPRFFAGEVCAPRSSLVSLAYAFADDLCWYLTYRITADLPDRLSLGQSWTLHRRVTLRLGVRNQPLDLCGGLSVELGGFSFDYSYTNNVYLGGTHQLGLRYER